MTEAFAPTGLTSPQDWLDGLQPKLPSMSPDMIKHELLTTMRHFFERSNAWQDWHELKLKTGVVVYSPEMADIKAEICTILNGYVVDGVLDLVPTPPGYSYTDRLTFEVGEPRFYFLTPERRYCIFPSPPSEKNYTARLYCSMRPIDLCVPTWIQNEFYETLCHGVLARLYNVPGILYKPDLATQMYKRYMADLQAAKTKARLGNTGATEQAVPMQMGLGSQRLGRAGYRTWGFR